MSDTLVSPVLPDASRVLRNILALGAVLLALAGCSSQSTRQAAEPPKVTE